MTVAYTKPKELRLSVAQNDRTLLNPYTQNGYEAEETQAAYYGTVNTILTVNVIYTQDNQSWSDLTGYGYTDHTLKISGGKILSSDIGAGQYQMIVTGKSATLTLLDNANNKKQHVYTINNEEYSAEKAPKVQPAGKTKTLSVGTLREAVMTYSVEQGGSQYVIIEPDAVSEQKNAAAYRKIRMVCEDLGNQIPVFNGTVAWNFKNVKNLPAGSYKFTFTFVQQENDHFKAVAKPVAVTLKTVKPKQPKCPFKLENSYEMDSRAGAQAPLKAAGNYQSVQYLGLLGKM